MDAVPSLDPGSPRVRFGAELRRLRETAQLSQAAVAARLGCTQTQVSRLEKATRTPSKSDAERLDLLFGQTGGVSFTRLYQRIVAQPGGPAWFRSWAEEIEPTAQVLRSWDPLLVPGLLQTEAYARQVFSQAPQISSDEVEERVQARIRRQRILDRDNPPLVLVLIDAGVLRRKVGGAEVMREQHGRLLEATRMPTVSIQVVSPECLTGLMGAFTIAELPDGQPDAIHAESSAEGQVTTDLDSVTAVWKRYEAIRLWAYPEHVSLKMIEEARLEWT
ncbi:helix-turn-helix domain-containing protein [Planomonospora parontospora]|uniref:helix-turn-helix domain-containing protein n=1 Tax=Planomonospora parontospora TaxID=58119 RepID=UPI00166F9A20|nr:helix-turn-helix transcriptional regulator [Planomonospora parontospora]GGL31098.1 transcriptional regulator [Planomonospora parontospora subsp. antibiotica]GII16618.1 transcriptional regulator [Planomonospora parontospora subsp. antibiotica]